LQTTPIPTRGDTISVSSNTDPAHGTAVLQPLDCTYTPDSGYLGPDSSPTRSPTAPAKTDSATVTITVFQPNRPPVAQNDFGLDRD